jgi:hypothetical protein
MKKHFNLLLTLFLLSTLVSAQEGGFQYLFGQKDLSFSGFGGPIEELSLIDGDLAFCNGGGGALIINQSFFIGGYGMGLSSRNDVPNLYGLNDYHLDFGHGGMWFGFINNSRDMVHYGGSIKLGAGQISIREFNDWHHEYAADNIVVINPTFEAEVNVTSWFKMNMGLGYRLVGSVNKHDKTYIENEYFNGFKSRDFNSPMLNISFLFGYFR